jgi:hypothetical protein
VASATVSVVSAAVVFARALLGSGCG